ncbi:MAG: hypothetical protein ABJB66_13710 [Gemmatimonadaceae bacterium]
MLCFFSQSAFTRTLSAQPRPSISVSTPTASTGAQVSIKYVLADKAFDELMRGGFPVRMRLKAELWRSDRMFNELVESAEWQIIVRFDQLEKTYSVARLVGTAVADLGTYKKLQDAQRASELEYTPVLPTPPKGRGSYVAVQADVQTMEMSDLAELQSWLRGEAKPAVQGKKNPGKSLLRGISSLGSRLLGAQIRHVDGRSETFVL